MATESQVVSEAEAEPGEAVAVLPAVADAAVAWPPVVLVTEIEPDPEPVTAAAGPTISESAPQANPRAARSFFFLTDSPF